MRVQLSDLEVFLKEYFRGRGLTISVRTFLGSDEVECVMYRDGMYTVTYFKREAFENAHAISELLKPIVDGLETAYERMWGLTRHSRRAIL